MPLLTVLLPFLGDIAKQVAGHFFPNPADEQKRLEVIQQFQLNLMQQAQVMEEAASKVVLAEASSENWLASSWRPITMLVFVALIVARWFGWAAPNLAEEEYLMLWEIVKIGLGGYVVGRSVEKIVPSIAAAISKREG
jgi:hypothetical protein